jgi:hypothetical protein
VPRASIDPRRALLALFAAGLAGAALLARSADPVAVPPQASQAPVVEPSQPFLLPTYSGESPSLHTPDKPPAPGPAPDARDLYERALACWPVRSLFRGEVTLEGRLRNERGLYLDDSNGVSSGGSRASAALVARIPLYSAIELDREREREWSRRVRVAESAGAFVSILAERDKLRRQLDLLRALERRSQERVKAGVAETAEQVAFMEKVAGAEGEIVRLSGLLQKARIELLGNCHERQADGLDAHLQQLLASHRGR